MISVCPPVRKYAQEIPIIPNPTTHIPITTPPEKATSRALPRPPFHAAFVVLTFAFVATFIPT